MSIDRIVLFKRRLRARMLIRRRAQTGTCRTRHSLLISKRLQKLPEYRMARTIALYLSMGGEVDVDVLLQAARDAGKRTAVPAWRPRERCYRLRQVTDNTRFRIGRYGLREPVEGAWLAADACELIVVPGTAFDRCGIRVGMGAGWYDRLLQASGDAILAGVAFGFQLVPRLPRMRHDVAMDLVVTESETIRCKYNRNPKTERNRTCNP